MVAYRRLQDDAFESDAIAQIVLDAEGMLAAVNASARRLFGLSATDIGRPLQDLELLSRWAELRSISFAPLFAEDDTPVGARVSFVEAGPHSPDALPEAKRELESAFEELQFTNEGLGASNDGLQSKIEELEAVNDELQFTNDGLLTMNEELQSANDELQTMSDQLRQRSADRGSTQAFVESVLAGLRPAVIVLDRDLNVLAWNRRAEDLWGIRSEAAHRAPLLSLDIGLPVTKLREPLAGVLSGAEDQIEVILPATGSRGRPIECRISVTPVRQRDRTVIGAILTMEEVSVQV